ncbi:hypothetical protein [Cytophaga aurantiaca]|uniref:hypothetical protein n=1 Tax=Cytophaga aurantiaca TaxID=29530 RepID=UPI00036B9CCD|nr:hypothetical protein [Cytophaga aurantiaca]
MEHRIIIYTSDIQLITGKKYKPALALLHKIKKSLNKSEGSFVTIDEFCIYTGLEKEEIIHLIKDL